MLSAPDLSTPPASGESVSASPHLLTSLLDYEAAPGRYSLLLRQPEILFDHTRVVLMMSAGRGLEDYNAADAKRAQRAATFFVRTAMFRSNADHYTLLGLRQGCSDKDISDHYRLLMRLIHPDFASAKDGWPRDAAVRTNLANDTLSSVQRRASYDESLAPAPRRTAETMHPRHEASAGHEPTRPLRPQKVFWAAGVLGVVIILFFQFSGQDSDSNDSALSLVVPLGSGPASKSLVSSQMQSSMHFETFLPNTSLRSALIPAIDTKSKTSTSPLDASSADKAKNLTPGPASSLGLSAPDTAVPLQILVPRSPVLSSPPTTVARWTNDRSSSQVESFAFRPLNEQVLPVVPEKLASNALPTATAGSTVPLLALIQPATMASVAPAPVVTKNLQASTGGQTTPAPSAALTLADAQLPMNQLLQTLQSGQGEEILKGLDRSIRRTSGAADLVQAYNHLVGSSRAVELGPVKLNSRSQADQLVIEGVVQLVLQDQGQPAPIRELRLRALFERRDGRVVLTELSTSQGRP